MSQDISKKVSPQEIVTGRQLDVKKDFRAPFEAYVEASIDENVTNTMKYRTHSCLSLGPAGNLQGLLKIFDILTGKVVTRRTIKVLPMPDGFLKTLNRWGLTSRKTVFGDKLEFLNRMKSKYDWDNDYIVDNEEGLVEPEPNCTGHHGILAEIPGVDLESDEADESENKKRT